MSCQRSIASSMSSQAFGTNSSRYRDGFGPSRVAGAPVLAAAWIRSRPVPLTVLAAAFLFNLGQGVLRPAMPLYLQRAFGANYRMVTLIPVVFGAGKWMANLPTGYLLRRLGRPLMICGLL